MIITHLDFANEVKNFSKMEQNVDTITALLISYQYKNYRQKYFVYYN